MEIEIKHTSVFTKNLEAYNNNIRFIANQGGTRSSKTYSIIQMLVFLCLTTPKLSVSIVRSSLPLIRGSVMRDFIDILTDLDLYSEDNHNKTSHIYDFSNGSSVEFFATESSQKLRGRKRDIAYCNEANEMTHEQFIQLNMRTSKCIILDYNPSDNESWLYDLIERDNSILIKSTYLDNLFLPEVQIKEIENLINVDDNYYKIYVLGERPIAQSRIYSHFQSYENHIEGDVCYGLDMGFNDPMVLIKCTISDKCYYFEEIIYKQFLTTSDLVQLMSSLNIEKNKIIYCDHRPEVVEELRRHGYNIKNAVKDIEEGIIKVKSVQVFLHRDSINTWKEVKMYSWKTKNDIVLDDPIDLHNHAMDCIRYVIYSRDKAGYNPHLTKFFYEKKAPDISELSRRRLG